MKFFGLSKNHEVVVLQSQPLLQSAWTCPKLSATICLCLLCDNPNEGNLCEEYNLSLFMFGFCVWHLINGLEVAPFWFLQWGKGIENLKE